MAETIIKTGSTDISAYIKEYSVIISDLDSDQSGRNANGKMLRDVIRTIRKINITLNPLTTNEMNAVLNSFKGENNSPFFSAQFLDPSKGGIVSGKFYVGDRTVPVYGCINGAWLWSGASFNLIEQ